jgi:hypothetical protein
MDSGRVDKWMRKDKDTHGSAGYAGQEIDHDGDRGTVGMSPLKDPSDEAHKETGCSREKSLEEDLKEHFGNETEQRSEKLFHRDSATDRR